MKSSQSMINGMLLGAGLMYLLDPDRGNRRRALLRDQLVHGANKLGEGLDTAARDLSHRSYGTVAEAKSWMSSEEVGDEVLVARVRSAIGRVVSHPGSIHVEAGGGHVTLSGPVLAREVEGLLYAVGHVRGVRQVENQLDVHERAGDVPGLQGEGSRPGHRFDVMQENWAPATRLLASMAGGALALYGLRSGGITGTALGAVGLGLLARGTTNIEAKRLVGIDSGRRAVDIRKTINVNAPVERVFDFWSHFENFPRFMSHLKEVRRTGTDASHWVARGPAGVSVEWDAIITQFEPNQVIAWKSVPGSVVGSAGIVRFQPNEQGGTRVDIRMSYNPPAGALGHAVASFFSSDPRHAMNDDLVRLKSLVEHGKTTAHGETVRREQMEQAPELTTGPTSGMPEAPR